MRSFLRRISIPVSAIPRRATAEPPSGTALPFAENENIALVCPPAFWVVKAQVIAVGSNPFPLTIPVPSTVRDVAVRCVTVDERRSKVKPAALHRAGVGVDGLNTQGAENVAGVFTGMEAKSPVPPASTWVLNQATTVVAVNKEFVLKLHPPAKLMFPLIAVAWACWLKNAELSMPVVRRARSVFDSFISFIWVAVSRSSKDANKGIRCVRNVFSICYDFRFARDELVSFI
jgi:hypothetical protein